MLVGKWSFSDPGNPGADATGSNDASLEGGTYIDQGAAIFDGSGDYIEVPPSSDFQHSDVTIAFSFSATSTDSTQGLVSRDSTSFDGGGHLTIRLLSNGRLEVRHQSDSDSYYLRTDKDVIKADTEHDIVYAAGSDGVMRLWVDGTLVDTNTQAQSDGEDLSLAGNNEPWVIGANQWQSGDGTANNLNQYFEGSISYVEIYDQEMTAAEVETAQSNPVPCFSDATFIETATGPKPICELRAGEYIQTLDNGLQRLVAVLSSSFSLADLIARPSLCPVLVDRMALGQDLPLVVSPQHGLLMKTAAGEEKLFRSMQLANSSYRRVRRMKGCRGIRYVHLLFEKHEIVFANGVPAESFYPGPRAMRGLSTDAKVAVGAMFPALLRVRDLEAAKRVYGDPVRAYARSTELKLAAPRPYLPITAKAS